MASKQPTAIQVGLVPGFALQDGDLLARLLHSAGSWGLGPTINTEGHAEGSNNFHMAFQMNTSFLILTHVSATDSGVKLPSIGIGSSVRIYNMTPHVAHVFPPELHGRVDAAPPGTSVWLSGNARCDYTYVGDDKWLSNLLGVPSA